MNVRTGRDEQRATGFQFSPAGPYLLRDYSNDDPDSLIPLRVLLEQIITGHKMLIPGQLNRLLIQWHADLHNGILAGSPEPGPPGSEQGPR